MRHNDARKWLHAVLDLLPVILIPVFMIYSHRHTIDSGSIDVPVNKIVDFNQLIELDDFRSSTNDYSFDVVNINGGNAHYSQTYFIDIEVGNKYYVRLTDVENTSASGSYSLLTFPGSTYQSFGPSLYPYGYIYDNSLFTSISYGFVFSYTSEVGEYFRGHLNLINLTKMFGAGNEPTIEQFNQWYSEDYYAYTLSSKQLLKGYSTQTYEDTDIMSQFTYQLYNSVDKYFNMGNIFNLGNVYDWFNLNIFGGTAPISIYIVWNIVLYEFVMDLLFLLYGLFMWFIDMCKKLMEKPLNSIK